MSDAAKGKKAAEAESEGPEIFCNYGSCLPRSGSPSLRVGLTYSPTSPTSHLDNSGFLSKMVELATLPLAHLGGVKSPNERFAEVYRSLLLALLSATKVQESMAQLASSNSKLRESGAELIKDLAASKKAEEDAKAREAAGLVRARTAEAELHNVTTLSQAVLEVKEENLRSMGSELSSSKRQVGELMSQLSEAKAGLAEAKDGLELERRERKKAEEALSAAEKALLTAEAELVAAGVRTQEAATQAVSDYKASEEFMVELCEGASGAYYTGFGDCRTMVAALYPDLDLAGVAPNDTPVEGGSGDEEEEEEDQNVTTDDVTDGGSGDAPPAEAEAPSTTAPPEAPAELGEAEVEEAAGSVESRKVVTIDDEEPQAE